MEAYNFIFKAEWIKRLDGLNKEQRTLTVMAIYDYIVYGKLSDNNYVNFAISWIRDEIDRMKQARERREARKEEKRRIAEKQKNTPHPTEQPEASEPSEHSGFSEFSEIYEISEPSMPSGALKTNCTPPGTAISRPPHLRKVPQHGRALSFRDYKQLKQHHPGVHNKR